MRVAVLSAGIQDWDGIHDLCRISQPVAPRVTVGWIDQGFRAAVTPIQEQFGWTLLVVGKQPGQVGFAVQPRRWVVERTFAWLGRCRRLAKHYEELAESAEAWCYLAMIHLMLHRLAP